MLEVLENIEAGDMKRIIMECNTNDIMLFVKAHKGNNPNEYGTEIFALQMDLDEWMSVWRSLFSVCDDDAVARIALSNVVKEELAAEGDEEGDDVERDAVDMAMMFASHKSKTIN